MTVPRDVPYTWVTWVAKPLVGESACIWASWFKTHYWKYDQVRSGFDTAGWNMKHTRALSELADRLESEGCEVFLEGQNSFRLTGSESGAIVAGKPDLVAMHPDGRVTVYDVKTGRERDSHEAQVTLYMYLLPRVRGGRWNGMMPEGGVVYGDGRVVPVPSSAIDDEFRGAVRDLMRRLVSDTPARRVPSEQECRFCDIGPGDCPERIEPEVDQEGTIP